MHQSVEVIVKKVANTPTGDLHCAYFQMVYIITGKGTLGVNGDKVPYWQGNLLLLTPDDRHNFESETETEFLLIRFYPSHIKSYQWKSIDHVECLLYHAPHLSSCILRNPADIPLAESLITTLLQTIKQQSLYNEDLTIHIVNALIVIAARNIASIKPASVTASTDKRIHDIIHHIQKHILHPQQLRAAAIAKEFGLSSTYLSSYFKDQCGETIQHFIANYRIRLIEHRLKFSDQRINEIASDLGFTDESHLNKFFKKYKEGTSLTTYRKMASA